MTDTRAGRAQRRTPVWRAALTGVIAGLLAGAVTMGLAGRASAAAPSDTSPPGTVAGVPGTSSEVTVTGRGAFSHLKITVSQTRDLVNQAIGISWTGGVPTGLWQSTFTTNFLQIMECWGAPVTDQRTLADADNYVRANPGPPREQCEYGGGSDVGEIYGGAQGVTGVNNGYADNRVVAYNPSPTSQIQDNLYKDDEVPFRPVDGQPVVATERVNDQWANPYYDITTTNEIPFSYTWPDGTGSAVLQADTQLEAPGLGCGEPVGSSTPRECWLVIVPRGATDINGQTLLTSTYTLGSPLTSVNWQNRIAIPLQYRLVTSPCPIGANEHKTQGSELAAGAMTSWQARLCAAKTTVLGYSGLEDDRVRQQLASAAPGTGELGFLSRPVAPSAVPAGEKIVYAPVTLSGVTISFNIDDLTALQNTGPPVTQINLTPRLVAKLLTDSYWHANSYRLGGTNNIQGIGTPAASHYAWLARNPPTLFADKDFQQYNPQFSGSNAILPDGENGGSVMVELTGSDAAYELWSWILADPSARAFLAGKPDPWGMTVDPYFSTSRQVNPAGVGLALPSSSYPNSDPWCGYIGTTSIPTGPKPQPPLCMPSYRPYTDSMTAGALDVLLNNSLQKIDWQPFSNPPAYHSVYALSPPGGRTIMGVTTTDAADRYGIIDARLQNAAGRFVAPDTAGLQAGAAAMRPSAVPGVLQPNFAAASSAAYPLTLLTYAAVAPATVTKADCDAYAALLTYAAGPGQVPGTALGDLPPGYAPLPRALTAQALSAASTIARCQQSAGTPGHHRGGKPPGHGGHPSSTASPSPSSTGTGTGTGSPPGAAATTTPGSTGSTPGSTAAPSPGSSASPRAGSVTAPPGGPSPGPGLVLADGVTPANPRVFGDALPIGAAAGLIATGAALLISRRRLGALRLLRPRGPWRGGP